MADKLEKFLAKLNPKDFTTAKALILNIQTGQLQNISIKRMKGHKNTFRARKGRLRIIWIKRGNKIDIIHLSNRDDQTYRDF